MSILNKYSSLLSLEQLFRYFSCIARSGHAIANYDTFYSKYDCHHDDHEHENLACYLVQIAYQHNFALLRSNKPKFTTCILRLSVKKEAIEGFPSANHTIWQVPTNDEYLVVEIGEHQLQYRKKQK